MRIYGLKIGRYGEWVRAIVGAAGRGGIVRSVVKMVRGIATGGVTKKTWVRRMRTCMKCPLFHEKVCLVVDGDRVFGCGCYVPFKAMVKAPYEAGCWAKEYAPGSKLGWVAVSKCSTEHAISLAK